MTDTSSPLPLLGDALDERQRLWLRERLAAWRGPLLVALLLLAAAGGYATYRAHVNPATTIEERTVSTWESSGSFDHGATVTRENPVFNVSRRLSNRDVYFFAATPTLDGQFAFLYRGSDGTARVAIDLDMVLQSTDSETGTTYWTKRRDLDAKVFGEVEPGERLLVPFSVNVSQVANRTAQIEEALGGSPGEVTTRVVATVRMNGTVAGQDVGAILRYRLNIAPGDSTFTVSGGNATTSTYETTRQVPVPADPGPGQSIGGPLLVVVSLGGLLALVATHGDLALSERERERLAYLGERKEYDDWIARMYVPGEVLDRPTLEAETLGDLVDYGIDADRGVIELPSERFVVLDEQYCYTYRPPARADVASSDPLAEAAVGPRVNGGDTEPDTSPAETGTGADQGVADAAPDSAEDADPAPTSERDTDPTPGSDRDPDPPTSS